MVRGFSPPLSSLATNQYRTVRVVHSETAAKKRSAGLAKAKPSTQLEAQHEHHPNLEPGPTAQAWPKPNIKFTHRVTIVTTRTAVTNLPLQFGPVYLRVFKRALPNKLLFLKKIRIIHTIAHIDTHTILCKYTKLQTHTCIYVNTIE